MVINNFYLTAEIMVILYFSFITYFIYSKVTGKSKKTNENENTGETPKTFSNPARIFIVLMHLCAFMFTYLALLFITDKLSCTCSYPQSMAGNEAGHPTDCYCSPVERSLQLERIYQYYINDVIIK